MFEWYCSRSEMTRCIIALPQDARPEARRLVAHLIPSPEGERLEEDDQQCQPHRKLGEEIVIGGSEPELEAVPGNGIHKTSLFFFIAAPAAGRSPHALLLSE